MKVKVISFLLSRLGWLEKGGGYCLDEERASSVLSDFCADKEVVDIKVNTSVYDRHNNGGADSVRIVYTILYREKGGGV